MTIPFLDLGEQNRLLSGELRAAFDRVLHSGHFILGEEVQAFESAVAELLGVKHTVGVSSGTDALLLTLMALGIGPGDEVITTPFSFFATVGCIARLGARPVFVDIDPRTFNIDVTQVEQAVTPRTRALIAVHLFGQPCAMRELTALTRRRGIFLVEDSAQSIGAVHGGRDPSGNAACYSFFPSKNLGGFGDGGLIATDDAGVADKARLLRAHGARPKYHHVELGGNFRLDALQAALLRVKLPHLSTWTEARRANARNYTRLFAEARLGEDVLVTPEVSDPNHVFNQYVVRTPFREGLRKHLQGRGIGTEIYYPSPLHLQPCLSALGYAEGSFPVAEQAANEVLALPIFPELGEGRLTRVAEEVIAFCRGATRTARA